MSIKCLRKITQQLLLMCYMLKKEHIPYLHIETQLKSWEANDSFNDSKLRRMKLSFSKKLSALLKGITSKHKLDFYCLNYLYFYRTKRKLESHKEVCKNKDFCGVVMPSKSTIYYSCRSRIFD